MTSFHSARLLEVISEAPNGQRTLEDIVLELAVHGALTRSDDGEKRRETSSVDNGLPSGWASSTLRQLCTVVRRSRPH